VGLGQTRWVKLLERHFFT